MKTIKNYSLHVLLTISILISGVSCKQQVDDGANSLVKNLELESPNGFQLASTLKVVEEWALDIAVKKFDYEGTSVQILNIEYTFFDDSGFSTMIKYQAGKEIGNFGIIKYKGDLPINGKIEADCTGYKTYCTGSSCCRIAGSGWPPTFQCDCDGSPSGTQCSMVIECIQEE